MWLQDYIIIVLVRFVAFYHFYFTKNNRILFAYNMQNKQYKIDILAHEYYIYHTI